MTGSNGVLVKAYTRYTRRYTHGRVSEGSGALYIGRQRLSLSLIPRKNSRLSTRSGQPINLPLSRVIGREIQYEKESFLKF